MVFTMPNADTGGRVALRHIREFVDKHPHAFFVDNLGTQAYFSLMKIAAAMVGNSSSGIIEAASFQLPVVNVGNRQAGRVRGRNVIDVEPSRAAIEAGLGAALGRPFRDSLAGLENPYGSGRASEIIVGRIAEEPLGDRLIVKRFHDAPRGKRP
jgi:UDP-N-acetylglucosamine 2-epimerase